MREQENECVNKKMNAGYMSYVTESQSSMTGGYCMRTWCWQAWQGLLAVVAPRLPTGHAQPTGQCTPVMDRLCKRVLRDVTNVTIVRDISVTYALSHSEGHQYDEGSNRFNKLQAHNVPTLWHCI